MIVSESNISFSGQVNPFHNLCCPGDSVPSPSCYFSIARKQPNKMEKRNKIQLVVARGKIGGLGQNLSIKCSVMVDFILIELALISSPLFISI